MTLREGWGGSALYYWQSHWRQALPYMDWCMACIEMLARSKWLNFVSIVRIRATFNTSNFHWTCRWIIIHNQWCIDAFHVEMSKILKIFDCMLCCRSIAPYRVYRVSFNGVSLNKRRPTCGGGGVSTLMACFIKSCLTRMSHQPASNLFSI